MKKPAPVLKQSPALPAGSTARISPEEAYWSRKFGVTPAGVTKPARNKKTDRAMEPGRNTS